MATLALSGDPRPMLTEYILGTHGNDAIHYVQDINNTPIKYVCRPKKNDPTKLVRGLEIPSKEDTSIIGNRVNTFEGDIILFHVIMEQKGDCNAPKDGRAHGVMLLYNRATKEVYTYDILRYHYRGFKANVMNKTVKRTFIPWLESIEFRGDESAIDHVELQIKDTSPLVIQFLTDKYGRAPYAREWYPLLALWEIHTIFEMTEQSSDEVISNMLAMPDEDREMLLEELYTSFQGFTEHVYSMYNLRCQSATRYDPELQSCVSINSSVSKSASASARSKSKSKSSIEIFDIGLVDSPSHNRHRMGNEYGQVIMMKYFAEKYPINPYMPKTARWDVRKRDYMMHWEYDVVGKMWKLTWPKNLPRFLKSMRGSEHAMILLRLVSKPKENGSVGYHLNTLLYNRKTNEIEHFEPHGSMLADDYDAEELYRQMKEFLSKQVPDMVYVPPTGFCMNKTFFQRVEADEMGFTYEHGMCAVWCYWYIQVRLANPELTRDEVVKRALKALHRIGSFRTFIRNYEKYYMHMINDIVEKHYLSIGKRKTKMVLDPDSYFV